MERALGAKFVKYRECIVYDFRIAGINSVCTLL